MTLACHAGRRVNRSITNFTNSVPGHRGSFIPFASTRQERLAIGDSRPSFEERYPTKEAYVAAFKKATNDLVAQRFLLADDATRLILEAERDGIRSAP